MFGLVDFEQMRDLQQPPQQKHRLEPFSSAANFRYFGFSAWVGGCFHIPALVSAIKLPVEMIASVAVLVTTQGSDQEKIAHSLVRLFLECKPGSDRRLLLESCVPLFFRTHKNP